jgi:hypothetical protein
MLTEALIRAIKPVRYERRVTDGKGLFLLVTPKGALHWRFRYRFAGKRKTVALGTYPVVTLDWARSRHQSFRNLLAHGIDPSALKAALGKHRFGVTMREWEAAQGCMHAGLYFCPVCGVSNLSIPKRPSDIRNCAR